MQIFFQNVRFCLPMLLILGLGISGNLVAVSADERLNVVFVLCDDHRFDCFVPRGTCFWRDPH